MMQASGEAKFTGNYGIRGNLHAYPVLSTRPLATIESIDPSAALQVKYCLGTTKSFSLHCLHMLLSIQTSDCLPSEMLAAGSALV